jgi:hypothetical protein
LGSKIVTHPEVLGSIPKRASVTALFMAAQKHFPSSVPSDTDDADDTDYDADAAYESDD